MSKEPNIFGLIEYSRHDLFVDTTDAVREADRFYIMTEADVVLKDQEELITKKDMEISNLKAELSYIKADSAFDRDKHKELLKSKDAEIAELKAKLAKKDEEITRLESACRAFATERDANQDAIYELRKEIESLKASHYAEMVDAGMRERRLRGALWLARAERAEARKNYWYARSIHEGDNRLWSIDGSAVKYIGCIKRTNFDWLKIWSEVECKCRAKAEEF